MKTNRVRVPLLRRLEVFVLVFVSGLLLFPQALRATESYPDSRPAEQTAYGTLHVTLEELDIHHSPEGVEFELFRMANYTNGRLMYRAPFTGCTLGPDALDSPQAMQKALSLVQSILPEAGCPASKNGRTNETDQDGLEPEAIAKTDADGLASLSVASAGLFVLHPSSFARYGHMDDLLVMLPALDPKTETMKRELTITPKAVLPPLVQIQKVDENRKPVTGLPFAFRAWQDEMKTISFSEAVGDMETGLATFVPALGQRLWIEESKAPEGYERSDRLVEVFLGLDGTLFVDGRIVKEKEGAVVVEYVNRREEPKKLDKDRLSLSSSAGDGTKQPGTASLESLSDSSSVPKATQTPSGSSKPGAAGRENGRASVATASVSHAPALVLLFFGAWSILMSALTLERNRQKKESGSR